MQLLALSDVHVEHEANRRALMALAPHPRDWLVLAGDVSDTPAGLAWALDTLQPKFAQLVWVPGNHDLWTSPSTPTADRGVAHYHKLVATCRARAVLTPEDPFAEWPELHAGRRVRIAPLFVLYDYTFAPDEHTGEERAVAWAADGGIAAADQVLLHPHPHATRGDWCRARVAETERRLEAAAATHALVLVNHWPLRRDVVRLGRVPRYSPWCGTRATEDWHVRFGAIACVHGHLHVRATDVRDDVRFEEVSLGYPRDWDHARGGEHYLRRVL
ncbi:MAG: metallophosphoesterase [Polyangiales bacterium]